MQRIIVSHPQMTCNNSLMFLKLLDNSCESSWPTKSYLWPPKAFGIGLGAGVATRSHLEHSCSRLGRFVQAPQSHSFRWLCGLAWALILNIIYIWLGMTCKELFVATRDLWLGPRWRSGHTKLVWTKGFLIRKACLKPARLRFHAVLQLRAGSNTSK